MSWLAEFHFLRPWALLLIIPLGIVVIALWRARANHSRWQQLIAPELLAHLIDGESQRQSRKGIIALAIAFIIACLALAGPAWERQSSPVHRQASALIVALDLSPSMVVQDVKPSRLVRARLKVAELLKARDEGETALIVYGDDAHVVTPLTDDTKTIATMLPTLSPSIMPVPGSRPEAAIERALTMFNDSGYQQGHILLVTDEVTTEAANNINKALKNSDIRLLILGVGTDAGAPIPSGRGGFIRDAGNDVVIARLGSAQLQKLAQKNGGRYITNTIDHQDIEYLNPSSNMLGGSKNDNPLKQKMDQWLDRGPWLVLLLLPVLLFSFRRGVVLTTLLLPLLAFQSPPLQAQTLDTPLLDRAFLTPDQRGAKALNEGDAASAAEAFKDPLWKGTAQYRAGNFAAAAKSFAGHDSALAHYNRGNALARTGKLDEALNAYQQALKTDPTMADAESNKALIEQLKKQQQEQQNQQQQDQSEQDSSQSDQQQSQDQQQQGEQNSESENNSGDSQSGASSSSPGSPANPQDKPGQSDQQNSAASSDPSSGESEQDPQAGEGQSSSARSQDAQAQGEQNEQQASSSSAGENAEVGEQPLEAQAQPLTPEEQEARQATEQWLRQIPDDPSGLLRNKFRYEYNQQRQDRQQKKLNTFGNSEQRW